MNVLIIRSNVNVYDIEHKIYSKFYVHHYRVYIIIFVVSSIVLDSHSTLLWTILTSIIYSIEVIVKYDYTEHSKEGFKKGYFKAIELKKSEKTWVIMSNY